jgi:hypothetical protein
MEKSTRIEVFLWSIAFPGFGQLLNGKLVKGALLIALEFLINSKSNLNDIIISSFHGEIGETIQQTEYQWLMFYPCIYMFGIWDAYKDAGGGNTPFASVPYAFGAYFGTVGVIFSRDILGAVWFGMVGCFIGVAFGVQLRKILRRRTEQNS